MGADAELNRKASRARHVHGSAQIIGRETGRTGFRLPIRPEGGWQTIITMEKTMHTRLLRNSLVASALVCALAAAPVSQVLANDSSPQGSSPAAQAMHSSDNQTMPGKANDGWITTKVKAKLAAASDVKSTDISVETTEGVVTLSGTVPTKSAKTHAVKDAKSIKGVKSVDAKGLTVGGM
ncbi:MAG: BON domain-containing protein [Rhodanobacter sp.]